MNYTKSILGKILRHINAIACMMVITSCDYETMWGSFGRYSLKLTDPHVEVDSAGVVWISNFQETYKYELSVNSEWIIEKCYGPKDMNGRTIYTVKPEYADDQYMAGIVSDWTWEKCDLNQYNTRYNVFLTERQHYSWPNLISDKTVRRAFLNERFTQKCLDKLPDTIVLHVDMRKEKISVLETKNPHKIILLDDSHFRTRDELDFPPTELIIAEQTEICEPASFQTRYFLKLTKQDDNPATYKGALYPNRRFLDRRH